MLITKFCLEIIYSKLQLHIIEFNELRLFDNDVIKCKHLPRYWPFVREFTAHRWIPLTKASDAELWCFLWSAPEHTVKQTIVTPGDLRRNRTHYDIIVMAMDVDVPVSRDIYIYIYIYIVIVESAWWLLISNHHDVIRPDNSHRVYPNFMACVCIFTMIKTIDLSKFMPDI